MMPDYQECVERIQRLQVELNAVRPGLHERVLEVAKRYIVAHHPTNRGYGYPEPEYADFEWNIECNSVYVEWNETWNYGGHDHRAFSFPVKYIWDEEALVAYEKSRTDAKAIRIREARDSKREEELQQLETLKEKYPEA